MKEYYCVRKMRDPDKNPGYIPCPDYELHGCAGCNEVKKSDYISDKNKMEVKIEWAQDI